MMNHMSRRVNPKVSVQPSDKLSAEVTKLRREQQAETKADATSNRADSDAVGSRGSKSGVSDSAVSHDPGAGPDNLASKGDSTSGRGTGGEGASGVVAAAPTGAHGAVTQAQDALGAQFGGGAITEHGRAEVDVEEVIADARGSLPMGQGREAANSMLFDDAARGDGTTGIAEMGKGGVSADPNPLQGIRDANPAGLSTQGLGPSDQNPRKSVKIEGMENNPVSRANTSNKKAIEEALNEDAPVTGTPAAKPDATPKETEPVDPTKPVELADGSMMIVDENSVYVYHPDGTSQLQTFDDEGNVTTVTRDANSKETSRTKTSYTEQPDPEDTEQPDPEDTGDQFRFVGEGLKERLGPKGVDGDGDIDFGDDIPFGVGAGAVLPDQRDALLGDAGRAGGVVEGPATSGGGALDPTGNAGAIDYLDETPFGGGLEDDPLAGSGPRREFDDARRSDDDDEDTEEDDDADTFAKGGDDPA
jgi:hypothetical protein